MTVGSTAYQGNFFDLVSFIEGDETKIVMELKGDHLRTGTLPRTFFVLKEELPGVLETDCINDKNMMFREYVKDTVVGHMFEHVLLEYLADGKLTKGYREVCFKGLTSWNWHEDRKGVFRISVDAGWGDRVLLEESLMKTITLVEKIFATSLLSPKDHKIFLKSKMNN